MLKAIQTTPGPEQQVATAEMELGATANQPAGAAALDYEVQAMVAQQLQQQQQQQQQAQLQQHHPQEAAVEEANEVGEYDLFRDYFGLINLVKSFANVPDELASPTNEYSFEEDLRERRDSLGSAGSEFSSSNSAESVEVADIYYTAYAGQESILRMKQAFMDAGEDGLKSASSTGAVLPTSLLLEHKIITAKKPQVWVNYSC